jgi:hypothetical protein
MSDLSEYVQSLRKQGYSDDYIKQYLRDYNYSDAEIQAAFNDRTVRHEHHLSITTFIILFIGLAVIGGIVYGSLQLVSSDGGEALLDVETEPAYDAVQVGETMQFQVRVTNLGDADEFDVTLTYELRDGDDVVTAQEETVAIATSLSRIKEFTAPDEPGQYTVATTATYEDKEATASFSINVEGSDTNPAEPSEPVENTSEETTADAEATLERVQDIAATQSSQAEELCVDIEAAETRDDCLSIIVRETRRAEFCDSMVRDRTRDECYLEFIAEGKTYLCDRVVLDSSQDHCERMRDVEIMARYR